MNRATRTAAVAWLVTAVYYFYQYTLRSAPAVMMPQLSEAFGLSAMGVASMVGLFYYGYSPFSLVAGAAMDRLGPRKVVPIGAATVGVGALLFATGNGQLASIGRFLQGAGGVFALVGAAYIATTNFPASRAATLIGATQMFGMAGGSAGQFVVGPMIAAGIALEHVLDRHGHRRAGDQRAALLPAPAPEQAAAPARRLAAAARPAHARHGLPESAVDPLRHDRGPAVHPDDDLRHDLGRPLPAGGARLRLRDGGDAVGHGAARLDHRLSAARLRLGPDRPAQAGDRRRRRRAARLPRVDPLRPPRTCFPPYVARHSSPDWRRAPRCCPTR